MTENKFKAKPQKEKPSTKRRGFIIMKLLDGSFMLDERVRKNLPFIFFLVFLAALNIANIYIVERKQRQIENLKKELSVLRAKHSFYAGKAAKNMKPSTFLLMHPDLPVKNSYEPVIKIKE